MKKTLLISFLFLSISTFAQEGLSIEDCYSLVLKNYPLSKQTTLLEKQNSFDIEIIKADKLPQLSIASQATYQSAVTKLGISLPNITIEPANKDQYKATATVNQLIYAGGMINASKKATLASLETKKKEVEVNLYQLKKQVNQLYFSILLQQEKKDLIESKKGLLLVKLKEIEAGIKYGSILPTSNKVIEAELLKTEQIFTEIDLNKINLIKTLSQIIGEDISTETTFKNPIITTELSSKIKRPELDLFQLKKAEIESNKVLISKQNAPKITSFATGGYGNPGLNMLDNSFKSFYTVGVKLNWKVFDWNKNKQQQASLLINKDIIENQQEIFELNTNIELDQQQTEISKINTFIKTDKQLIELRKDIAKSSAAQLKNGVITASAYITEVTNLYEAKNNLSTHNIQLLLAQANYKTIKGN